MKSSRLRFILRTPKRKLLLGFWLAQGLLSYALWPLLLIDRPIVLADAAAEWFALLANWRYAAVVGGIIFVLTGLQAVLLWPVRKPGVSTRGWPMRFSVAVAGLSAAALVTGLALAFTTCVELYDKYVPTAGGVGAALFSADRLQWLVSGAFVLTWAISAPLMLAYCRRTPAPESALARIATRLFKGTVIEIVCLIPLDVMARRKLDCYCAAGTLWALTVCIGVGLVVAGPAAFLPLLARRRRRFYAQRCPSCLYDLAGLPAGAPCPECGAARYAARRGSDGEARPREAPSS